MKTTSKIAILLLVFGGIISCEIQRPIIKMESDNNKTYQVEYLFKHEGCKVYRFRDQGHYVYFTNCNSDVTSIENDSTQTRVINLSGNKVTK